MIKKFKKMSAKDKALTILFFVMLIAIAAWFIYTRFVAPPKPAEPVDEPQATVDVHDPNYTKPPLMPTPEYTAPPDYEFDPSEYEADEEYYNSLDQSVAYVNDRVLKCVINDGMELSIGLEDTDETNGLILNPRFQYNPGDKDRYAFYLNSKIFPLTYSENDPASADSPLYGGVQFFAARGRTWDQLTPANYRSPQNYGVKWKWDSSYFYDVGDGDTINIRIINLDTGLQYGVARLAIEYDKTLQAFRLGELYNADVKYTRETTDKARDGMIADTIDFFRNGTDEFHIAFSIDRFDEMVKYAHVEYVKKTYFNQLYNAKSQAMRGSSLYGCDIYAVSIPYPSYGVFTTYYIPEPQTFGLSEQTLEEDGTIYYVLVGYDAFCPFSESTFIDNLYPDDRDFFLSGLTPAVASDADED